MLTYHRSGRRLAGFTLIELLLAIGLSALLLLVAVKTFQAATRTMGDIDRLADENRLIRAGWFMVTDDADRWHSHANPAYPYLRRHLSATDEANDITDVAPFRPVSWPADLDQAGNPNWPQPHDPRAWYRNHLTANVGSGVYGATPVGNGRFITFQVPDFGEFHPEEQVVEDWRKPGGGDITLVSHHNKAHDVFLESRTLPPGWNNWHVVGDYARLSNIDMPTAGQGELTPHESYVTDDTTLTAAQGFRPKQIWHVFQELGTRGCLSYLPAGSLNLILAPSDNETYENYADEGQRLETHFRKGEIPWSLHASANLLWAWEMDVLDGAREAGDALSLPAAFKNHLQYPSRDETQYNRQNYFLFMPTFVDGWKSRILAGRPLAALADFNIFESYAPVGGIKIQDLKNTPWFHFAQASWSPNAMVYPGNPRRTDIMSEDLDWTQFNRELVDGFALLSNRNSALSKEEAFFNKAVYTNPISGEKVLNMPLFKQTHWRDIRQRHTHTTWQQPRAHTDALEPGLDVAGETGGYLATKIHRYRFNGFEKAHCAILIQDADGEMVEEIRFRLLSTTYRGARQYWGRRSGATGVDDGLGGTVPMGDRYDR